MRQYRPTIEQLKLRYSCEMARRKMIERRHAAKPGLLNGPRIPSNSEPWLPHLPRSVAECMWVSDQITKEMERWIPRSQPTPLSAP
ncbi:MAG: hypothetical protein ACR2OZ_21265 [Verrucomicrobiales bacterium]